MREDQATHDDLVTEIGDATALTKGERLDKAFEGGSTEDYYDA